MEKQLIDIRTEMSRVNSGLLSLTGESHEIKKKCVPFNVTQVRSLKLIADRRFEALDVKVQKMKYSIFHDIMQTEMEMTGLCDENFSKHIPNDIKDYQHNKLLTKMSELKQHIMVRRLDGISPYEQHSSDEESAEDSDLEIPVKGTTVDYLRVDVDSQNLDEMDSQDDNLQDLTASQRVIKVAALKEKEEISGDPLLKKAQKMKRRTKKNLSVRGSKMNVLADNDDELQKMKDKLILLSMQVDMNQKNEMNHYNEAQNRLKKVEYTTFIVDTRTKPHKKTFVAPYYKEAQRNYL